MIDFRQFKAIFQAVPLTEERSVRDGFADMVLFRQL
jgi:hypothetical protein